MAAKPKLSTLRRRQALWADPAEGRQDPGRLLVDKGWRHTSPPNERKIQRIWPSAEATNKENHQAEPKIMDTGCTRSLKIKLQHQQASASSLFLGMLQQQG